MTDQPFHLNVTKDDIVAAMDRDDYAWLFKHVFISAFAQFMREKHTDAMVNGSTLPRSRRTAGTRRHRNHRTRRISQVPG